MEAYSALSDLSVLSLDTAKGGWGGVLLAGFVNSIYIAVGAYVVGLAIGLAGACGKLYGGLVTRDLLEVYTTVVRAVPELILILLLYYAGTNGLNQLLSVFGAGPIDINGLIAGIAVLGLVQGAYSTEVIRGAILAVPVGQMEAGRAYGMPPLMIFRRITIPAMLPHALRQSLADRHQGHGAARRSRFHGTDSRHAPGRRCDQVLPDLLSCGGGSLPAAVDRLRYHHQADRGPLPARHDGTGGMTDTIAPTQSASSPLPERTSWFLPHRIVMIAIFVGLVVLAALTMRWDWLPQYRNELIAGVGRSLLMLFSSAGVGIVFAILLGLAQVAGPKPLGWLAAGFCGIIRGTPLLLQLWLIYYGVGSIIAEHRLYLKEEWPTLFYYSRQSWIYGFAALTISFAAYEGEIMRGAFKGVPRGELEAAISKVLHG